MRSVTHNRHVHSQLALAAAVGLAAVSFYPRPALAGSGTWSSTAGGLWSNPANWSGGIVADGDTFTAGFASVDLPTTGITVSLDSPRSISTLDFGDTVIGTVGAWTLNDNGNPANVLTLGPTTPTINVAPGVTANIQAALAGTAGFTKSGQGNLVLSGTSTLAGNVALGVGTLSLTGTLNTASMSVSAGGTNPIPVFSVDGGTLTATALSTINAGTNSGQFILNSGNATFTGGLRTGNNDAAVIRVNGGTLNVSDIFVQRNGGAANSTGVFTSGLMFMGGTVNAGTIRLGTNNSNGAMTIEGANVTATGQVTLGNQTSGDRGGHLRILSGTFTSTDAANGLVLVQQNGASTANQQSNASFTGGVSTIEKISLGFNAAAIGRARVNVNGGELYLGSGGVVLNSASVVPTVTLSGGKLGAKDSWASGVPMILGTGGNITVQAADASNAARDINLSGVISGSGNLTKTGGGTLTLSGANTYTGAISVNAGTLAGTTSALRGNITNNTAVVFDQPATGTFTGQISGPGAVTKTGAGTATFANAQTYTGATTVAAGTLAINGAQATSGVTVQNGAGLALAGNATVNALTLGAGPGDAQTLRVNTGAGVNGLGILTANALVAHGTTTVDVGAVGLSAGVYPVLDYAGAIGGTGGGFGAFALGSLPARVTANLVDNTANSSIDLNISGIDFPRWIGNVNSTWDINTTQNWREVTSNNPTVYLQSSVPGDQVVFDDLATGSTTVNIATPVSPALVTFNNATRNYTLTGAGISGATAVIKQGPGTLTLSNTGNNYTGGTLVQNGTLRLGAADVLPAAGTVTVSGGTLDVNGSYVLSGGLVLDGGTLANGSLGKTGSDYDLRSGTVDDSASLSGAVGVTKSGPGTVVFLGQSNWTGATTVAEGNLQLGDATTNGVISTNINNAGTVTFNGPSNQTYANRIIGTTGTVVKNGSTTLTLNNVGNGGGNEGSAVINAGTVILVGGDGANPYNARLGRGGTITINNGATVLVQATDSLGLNTANLPPGVTLNAGGTLHGDSLSATSLYNGTFAGGTLSAEADAVWTLRGDYSATAGTTSNITAPTLNILNTPTFNTAAGATVNISGNMAGASGFEKTGAGTVVLSGANTHANGTSANGGVLVIAAPNALPVGLGASVGNTGTLRAQTGLSAALDVNSLNVAATGRVDVNDSGIVRRNGGVGATGQTTTRQLTGYLKTGLENGGAFDWQGPGISSTEAFNDNATAGSVLYGLGIVQNNLAVAGSPDGTTTDETPGNTIYTTFKGRTVGLNDTLVRYTYMGDADLDGAVTSTDYSLIDAGFGAGLAGWINGDFDYSGQVNSTDYALIDNAFGAQTGVLPEQVQAMIAEHTAMFGQGYVDALAAVQSGVVPEPAALGVLALAGVGLVGRRRRRN